MQVFNIPKELTDFVNAYDRVTYAIWNDEQCTEIKIFRQQVRNHYLIEGRLRCFYCRQYVFSINGLHWQVEHILPKSLFPQFLLEPKNLIVICPDCNGKKGNQNPHIDGEGARGVSHYPMTSNRFKIIHPVYDLYEDHIDRVAANHCDYPDHHFLKAKTKKGRATVNMCDLNRFYQEFAGYKDMQGKQVQRVDQIIELNLETATKEQKRIAIEKIVSSL